MILVVVAVNKLMFFKYLLSLICLFALQVNSQNFAVYKQIINTNKSIDIKIMSIDSLVQVESKYKESSDYFRIADSFVVWLYKKNRLEKSLSTLLKLIENTPPYDKKTLEQRRFQSSTIYRKLGNYNASILTLKTILKEKNYDGYYLKALYRIADDYNEIGDYLTSMIYYNLSEIELHNICDYDKLIKNTIYSTYTYNKISGETARSEIERKLLIADSLSKHYTPSTRNLYRLNLVLGNFYTAYENRNIQKGEPYLLKAIDLAKKIKDPSLISQAYMSYGTILDIESPEKSIHNLEEALKYLNQNDYNQRSVIYANLGLNQARLGNYDQSIKSQVKAIELALNESLQYLDNKEIYNLLSIEKSTFNLKTTLSNLAETYYLRYLKSKNKIDLNTSIQFFKYSDRIIDNYFNSDVSIQSKLLWREQAALIYSRAIRSCFTANDLESAFLFMEKSKALLLYEERANLKELQSSNIPDFILKKRRLWKSQINRLERSTAVQIDSLKKTIVLQDSLDWIHKEIIKSNLYQKDSLNTNFSLYTIAETQKSLNKDEAILTYHISADNGFGLAPNTETGYGILIMSKEKLIFEINDLSILKDLSNSFLKKLRVKQQTTIDFKEFQNVSISLYDKIIPKQIRTHLKDKHLTIIPDRYLNTLPFEALVTSPVGQPVQYLIEENAMHYLFSVAFNKLNREKVHTPTTTDNLNAFAPVRFQNMPSLENSEREIEMIDNHINSTLFSRTNASTTNFINTVDKSKILHLATHASSDNDDPWIQFSDDKIYLDQLSTLPNNASLVVLSACETTTGEIAAGEGILSLARGFFHGGTQGTLSSLWKVDDKATYQLMDTFYKHLSEGKTKSSALREAKLTYLATHSGSELSPYYWSSFILTGAIDPVPLSNNNWRYYVLCSIIITVAISVMLSRKRNKN